MAVRGSASRRVAPLRSTKLVRARHAPRLATALSSVVCDQEDEAEAEAEDGDYAGNEEAANEGEDAGCWREASHDEGARAAGMNDDVVDDVAEEDSRGDAREGSATTTTTTQTTTTAFPVYPPAAVRSARLTAPGRSDSAVLPAREIVPTRAACT